MRFNSTLNELFYLLLIQVAELLIEVEASILSDMLLALRCGPFLLFSSQVCGTGSNKKTKPVVKIG